MNKLLSAQVEVKLPVEALLKVCHGEQASQVTRSYALMYIEKGFLRESRSVQQGMLSQLLDSVGIFQAQEAKYVPSSRGENANILAAGPQITKLMTLCFL